MNDTEQIILRPVRWVLTELGSSQLTNCDKQAKVGVKEREVREAGFSNYECR